MTRAGLLAALLLATAACIPEEGPMMEPGSNCLECHDGGEAPRWTVAGTVGGSMGGSRGSKVRIQDANGKAFTLTANQAGNFWSAESVAFPLRVSVDGSQMPPPNPTTGSCNQCHGAGGAGD
jgi:hypothetical protein